MPQPRLISVKYNIDTHLWVDASGFELNRQDHPSISLLEQPIINIEFVRGADSNTPVPLPTSDVTYLVSADEDFDPSTDVFMAVDSSAVNQSGDWALSGDADPALGQMSIRLTGAQPTYAARLGSRGSVEGLLEVQIRHDTGGELLSAYRAPFWMCGLVNQGDPPVDPGPSAPVYVTTDMAGFLSYRKDVNWETDAEIPVAVPEGFLVQQIILTAGDAVPGLEFTVGVPGGLDSFIPGGEAFTDLDVNAVMGIATAGEVVLAITENSTAPATGKIIVQGIQL